MKNKTLKAEVAPAQVGEPYQSADSASESARQLSKSASLHLAHPWQAHSAHEFAASRHEVEVGTSKTPEQRERHFRLAAEHRKAAEYWAKKEASLVKPAPSTLKAIKAMQALSVLSKRYTPPA